MELGSRAVPPTARSTRVAVPSELNAIIAAEGTGSGTSAFLSQDRWDEMDWDKDETISFEEFVFAFYAWVDDDEEVENA